MNIIASLFSAGVCQAPAPDHVFLAHSLNWSQLALRVSLSALFTLGKKTARTLPTCVDIRCATANRISDFSASLGVYACPTLIKPSIVACVQVPV